ncbi:hypothetical protein HF526_25450 [Pseudonocardia sp. K10HN5]|uniref:Mce-associated membrane protein n=1 Tax=Pseudonocardia acidicola TaxID=2724939 RepID=A0ABX1SGD6_9PSEU|nr:hypothetical protein [Pseudonocardia acidicola]
MTLGGFAVVAVVVLVALVAFLLGRGTDPVQPTTPPAPGTPAGPAGQAPPPDSAGWDVTAETALATRPMLELPEVAAQPHELTTATAGPPLSVPEPTQTTGRWVPGGFPATPEGAVGQLAALTTAGFEGGDPQVYSQAYQSIALPGAPPADRARLTTDLQRFRARAGLPATGPVNGLTVTWQLTNALIKGTADDGRYAVVCVLGELTVTGNGQSVSGGGGDCQALRYVAGNWQISPGAAAAPAPLAWPGTAEAVAAGYRAVG